MIPTRSVNTPSWPSPRDTQCWRLIGWRWRRRGLERERGWEDEGLKHGVPELQREFIAVCVKAETRKMLEKFSFYSVWVRSQKDVTKQETEGIFKNTSDESSLISTLWKNNNIYWNQTDWIIICSDHNLISQTFPLTPSLRSQQTTGFTPLKKSALNYSSGNKLLSL